MGVDEGNDDGIDARYLSVCTKRLALVDFCLRKLASKSFRALDLKN